MRSILSPIVYPKTIEQVREIEKCREERMKEKDTEPYIVDGKIFQVYKIGKEPMNNQDDKNVIVA